MSTVGKNEWDLPALITLYSKLDLKIEYRIPPENVAEKYHREHVQNVFKRIAYRYFENEAALDLLKKRLHTELLLEGLALPKDIDFESN